MCSKIFIEDKFSKRLDYILLKDLFYELCAFFFNLFRSFQHFILYVLLFYVFLYFFRIIFFVSTKHFSENRQYSKTFYHFAIFL